MMEFPQREVCRTVPSWQLVERVAICMCVVAVLLLPNIAGCSGHGAADAARAIPGTEQVAIYDFAISVSPDERWMAFTEWVLPKSRVFEDLSPYEYPVRITTLDLKTGENVRHSIDSLAPLDLGFSADDPNWKRRAGLELIEKRFRPPGWNGNLFHLQPYRFLPRYSAIVALDVRVPGLSAAASPETSTTCSDCPPMTSVQFRDRTWDLLSNDVSAVVRDGTVSSMYFVGEGPYRKNMILRLEPDGDEELVVERQKKRGVLMSVVGIRVAPDERFLAYHVHSKKQAFLAGPKEELFVLELSTRREKRIARYGYMSNLVWSPDSQRLYFAGGEYSSDSAVRVVDVPSVFER
jgi:hypothetical protein